MSPGGTSKDHPALILGLGSYAPDKTLTNEDFARTLDTSDEWITARTGIKHRHIAAREQSTSDLAAQAARAALKDAHLTPADLDLILVATFSPDYITPATACVVQEKLGLGPRGTPACDVDAACTGFLYTLATAKAFIECGQARTVLVVGAETISRFTDYEDRSTCILFGDAAGAAVVGAPRPGARRHALRAVKLWADGRGADLIITPAGGAARPASAGTVAERLHFLRMKGREVFRFAVPCFTGMLEEIMRLHHLNGSDIGAIIPHQANIRIIEAAAERLGLPHELFLTNLAEYGNTSSASIPLMWDEAYRAGRLPAGKPLILLAFGGGLTWGWALIEW
jgi:3-oxoacyl-[acyl-carrier-protein] synthase-3